MQGEEDNRCLKWCKPEITRSLTEQELEAEMSDYDLKAIGTSWYHTFNNEFDNHFCEFGHGWRG